MTENKLRIIKIIDDNTIITNRIQRIAVNLDDKFKIVSPDGIEIKDPLTGESLGMLNDPKGIVYIHEIYDNFIVFKSEFIEEKRTSPAITAMKAMTEGSQVVKPAHFIDLDVELSEVTGSKETGPIKIGDYLIKSE